MENYVNDDVIRITLYIKPIIYSVSDIAASYSFNEKTKKYETGINKERIINGPLSNYGEFLVPPIADEFKEFQEDCLLLIQEYGFTVIDHYVSTDSKKSEYTIVYGTTKNGKPYGYLIFDIRVSDHPFDAKFPDELKPVVLEYLKMNKIIDGSATEAGIDFVVDKVTVGSVVDDTWDKAFNRLDDLLYKLKRRIRRHSVNRKLSD